MNVSKLTARFLALSLASASLACQQTPARADAPPVEPPARAATPAPAPANATGEAPSELPGSVPSPAPKLLRGGSSGRSGGSEAVVPGADDPFPAGGLPRRAVPAVRGFGANTFRSGTVPANVLQEAPAVVTTEPLTAGVQDEWREDLRVMEKLFRDALGSNNASVAMGIKVAALGRQGPMYIEGAGVVLGTGVGWPLAAGPAEDGKAAKQRDPASPWERAKRAVSGRTTGVDFDGLHGMTFNDFNDDAPQPPVFDQKKLDDLVENVLYVLPQASNFRHLKPTESVIITVVGLDDAGRPVRLTMKATKADIDDAAAKKIDAATFKQRVARRIG